MRIAQIMLAKGFGGAERSFVDLCAELVARGHEVLAICEQRGAALPLLRAISGLSVLPLHVWGSWDLLAQRALGRALREHRIEITQCHLARAAHLGGAAAHSMGLPTLAKTHNYVDLKYYRRIDCLVPTTHAQEDYLRAHAIPAGAITRIPNFARMVAVPVASNQARVPVRLLALGRLVEKKGFDVLLDAIALLRLPAGTLQVVIAGDGPARAALETRAQTLNASTPVDFVGWIKDVAPLFAEADLFVLPSRDEPFGIVLLEAMASGVPTIATRTAGPLEIFSEDTAVLVPTNDPQSLANAIKAYVADRSAFTARAALATVIYEKHYSAAVVVPQYEALYERLIKSSRERTAPGHLR